MEPPMMAAPKIELTSAIRSREVGLRDCRDKDVAGCDGGERPAVVLTASTAPDGATARATARLTVMTAEHEARAARCRPNFPSRGPSQSPTAAKHSTGSAVSKLVTGAERDRLRWASGSTTARLLMGERRARAKPTTATSGRTASLRRVDTGECAVSGTRSRQSFGSAEPNPQPSGSTSQRRCDAGGCGVNGAGVPGGLEAADRSGDADTGQRLVVDTRGRVRPRR